jgi:hypothetical protein
LHSQRRRLVECFLCDLGSSAAESSSHNVLERPWTLKSEEFTRRAKKYPNPDPRLFARVREQTAALTEEILNVEKEIDERVAGLYGL